VAQTRAAELEAWHVCGLLADALDIISDGFSLLDSNERIVLANRRYK